MPRRNHSHRNLMFMGASALVLCGVTPAVAFAQAAAPAAQADTVEEVVVTGQRAALQSAQKLKQNAEQLVDSITATDIGALPDRSVTEALQRVSGVTIGRTADGRDADRISVEGSGVQVRGLSWVRGELNGRDSFSAKAGRTLSFEDVPPELMSGVDVYKNPSADIIEGGVGGTVNLRTRLPFDSSKRILAYSADSSWGDLSKKWEPSGSVLYSNRWDTKIGEVGFLIDLSDSKLSSRTDTISVDPFFARTNTLVPGKTVYVPGGFGYRSLDFERERKGIAAALQWRPNDQWDASLQFLRSSASQASTEHAVGFNPGSTNWPATGTDFTYDSNGHFIKGTLAQSQTSRDSLGSSTIDTRYSDRSSVTSDYALNVKYTPNDKWAFSGDIQYVYAKTKTVDNTAFNALGADAAPASLDLTGSLPVITMNNNTAFTSNPANYYLIAAMDHHDRNEAAQWAERFDGDYSFDDGGWLKSFRFGVRHTFRQATTRETSYRWDTVAPSWSAPSIDQIAGYQGYYGLYEFDNYFRGKAHLPATFVMPSAAFVNNYGETSLVLSRIAQANGGSWRPFNGDFEDQTQFGGKGSTNHQKEETLAAYGMLRFGHDISLWGDQREIDGNLGLRVVKTESQSLGLQVFTPNTSSPAIPAADQAFSNGAKSPYKGGRDYVNILPSLNVRLKITPDMFIRFAAAKAIVRPDFQQLQPNYSITATNGFITGGACSNTIPGGSQANCVYQYTANAGNPDLKPTRSTQFDLSYEWYFNSTGSVTATAFYKDIYNFVTNGSTSLNFTNNGVTRSVQVVQPYNAGHGKIKGFEVAYQQYYDFLPGVLRGLGAQANFTYVDSEGSRNAASNPYDSNQVGNIRTNGDELPLEGLSKKSYNVAALYDLGKVSARLAYNWRERYLLTTTAANINIPAWYDDYGQLDGSVFYTVNDALKIGFQAANLTNTRTKILVSYPGKPEEGLTAHNWVVADRRYSIVLRGTF
ncbi:TonB-dependent receptor [Caulobacter sp. AP07]|uniref:TonB-dependent receptor n=1 Tax=Caulobacter sp. AP07 TaxID=1144304 RepID=UPI00027201A0|nr:TonB-dependent receptor [Caulobacter sp. AP07]EJL30320.1 TonB-dependent receptor [Caulobacter sp. AP07]